MRWLLTLLACQCLANDPLLTFDAARRVPFSSAYSLNVWQWWVDADTNAIHVYDAGGNYLPALDEPNGTNHANLKAAWEIQPHASNTLVSVIDNGLHGAQVASVIAAPGGDGLGLSGSARRVPIAVLPTHFGAGQVSSLIVQAVASGARIINMSFGYVDATPPVSVIEAMRTNSDVLFVLAALNGIGPEDNSRDWLCLAQLPNAICVTASTKAGDLFGAYGTNVHIAAPGRRVVVDDDSFPFPPPDQNLSPESLYASPRGFWSVTGTSFATGIMSGICALIRERYPNETPEQVIERICMSANTILGQHQTKCGAVDAYMALTYERTPRLAINRQSLTVAGPKDSISQVSISTNLESWFSYMTVTNTGWAQSFNLPSYSMAFFRL